MTYPTASFPPPAPRPAPGGIKVWVLIVAVVGTALVCGLGGVGIGLAGSPTKKNVAQPVATRTVTEPGPTVIVSAAAAITPKSSPTTPKSAAKPSRSAAGDTFVMPNEVGKILQTAQDDIQRVSGNPIFITYSIDATGQNRHQILDRDWKVCGQNVAPGKRVSQDVHITFSVVKVDESCPKQR